MGDEARLRQVVTNLLSNALEHTPRSASVRVTVATDRDMVELSVGDRGPGMSPEVVTHVFDRFFRADPGRARSRGGSGLGLAIVQSLVTAHDGSVTCRSTTPDGTTVTVRIPRRKE
jgi:two-component system OmpR family sensor kinase